MTITIEAPAELEEAVVRDAARAGLSVQEYTLRALMEKTTSMTVRATEDARILARREARRKIESGFYAWPGISSEAFMAERSEEAREAAE